MTLFLKTSVLFSPRTILLFVDFSFLNFFIYTETSSDICLVYIHFPGMVIRKGHKCTFVNTNVLLCCIYSDKKNNKTGMQPSDKVKGGKVSLK